MHTLRALLNDVNRPQSIRILLVRAGLCCLLAMQLSGCDRPVVPLEIFGSTMGTSYSVIAYPKSEDHPHTSEQLQGAIDSRLVEINKVASTYDRTSDLSQLNQLIAQHDFKQAALTVQVVPELYQLLADASHVFKQSQGYFDITVGALVNAWGFGPAKATINSQPATSPDAQLLIQRLLSETGQDAISLEGNNTVRIVRSVYLDLSALAKGWGVDEIARLVELQGINSYLIEIGGEIRVGEAKPKGPWRIAIEKPSITAGQAPIPLNILDVAGVSIATSGDYRNYREIDGRRYSHTIDPKTGRPVEHALASVTVLHAQAMLADAWATALNAMGPRLGLKLANQLQLIAVFISHDSPGFKVEYSDNYLAQYAASGDNR